jgi:TolA-binding protein
MVMIFTLPEFEQFAMTNTRIIMKMMKVFSNQLRRIHRQVENLLKTEEQLSPEIGLFKTGEYYLKNRMYAQAKYVFGRYLTYYPSGKMAQDAAKHLENSENSLARFGQGKGPAPIADAPPPSNAKPEHGKELSDVAKVFYNGVSLFSSDKFQMALAEFKKIVDANEDQEYVAKSAFEIGRCVFQLGQADAAIKQFTMMIQNYPKHPDIAEALFYIGQSYEKKADPEKAKAFYKKIQTMVQDDEDQVFRKAKRALKALEGGANG